MRSIDDLKKVKDRRPFEPFHLHLADGREIRISHPDAVAWDAVSSPRTVFASHDGDWDIIDLTLINSIRVPGNVPAAGEGSRP